MNGSRFIWFFIFGSIMAEAQTLSEVQQKAINNYILLANHLTGELNAMGPSLAQSYRQMVEYRKQPSRPVSPYLCKLDAKQYYQDEAIKSAAALASAGATLSAKSEAMMKAYQKVDATCKSIEIYFRLKDYQADNFKKFEELLSTQEKQVLEFSNRVKELHSETEKLFYSLQPYNDKLPYHRSDKLMRNQLAFERELIDAFSFNLNEAVHTGWPVEKTEKHILDDVRKIEALKRAENGINYPASSQVKSFIGSIESLQQSKRTAVDGYTFEKQQTDGHGNGVYNNLINYYTNTGVSFYNNFLNYARKDGFRGIYYLSFVPVFSVRSTVKEIKLDVTPYTEKTVSEFNVTPVATPVTAVVFSGLSNYVDFINDGVRQVSQMMRAIQNLNSSASSSMPRLKAGSRVNLDYYHKSFELPVTLYQETVEQTKILPSAYRKPLLDQAEVLYSILTELNQWNNVLLADAAAKQLTKDSLNHVYSIINRFQVLVQVFDEKKEHLYSDVRRVFESYKITNPKSSWVVSGNGMLALLDEDHKQLYKAKELVTGESSAQLNTSEVDRMARGLIENEYSNMTGLEKYGRSNGNCPYTPYEDIAEYSIRFSEVLVKFSPEKKSSSYRDPYSDLIYRYNQTLLSHYNKFTELSKVPLLKSVMQLELFKVVPPKLPEAAKPDQSTVAITEAVVVVPEATNPATLDKQKSKKNEPATTSEHNVSGSVVHDTVRITDIIRIETIRQDTVYVSRIDTVFIGVPGENIMSMEGYAINNMVLLLDVSGSMNTPDKLPLLKKSVFLLMKMMRPEDQISIVTYSGKAKVELQPTSFSEEGKIRDVIEKLKSEGKTDGNAGIKLAYQVADKNYIRGGNNRIVLATDGEFGIGNPTYDLVKKFAGEDILLTVFNFGQGAGSVKNLQQLATFGKGNYENITRENADMKLITEAKSKKMK